MEKLLQGRVISGQKLAKKFGIATANLEIFAGNLSETGVYIVESFLPTGEKLSGVMHYGKRETTDSQFSVEVHFLDFSRDLYGENLKIKVLQKIRETRKFSSVEQLFSQIRKDITQTRKFFLRRKIKEIWKNLDQKSREILAEKAFSKVSKLPDFLSAKNIYIYAPKSDEIAFVDKLCAKFPEKKYFFPKIINGEMKFFRGIFYELKVGKWGIREPQASNQLAPLSEEKIGKVESTLIFVPALGADFAGNRLGNGGGFYDWFLQKVLVSSKPPLATPCQGENVKTICVLPEFAVFPEIPVEEWDIKIDEVLVV